MKNSKKFSFIFPVSQELEDPARPLGKTIIHVRNLVINGVGYDNGNNDNNAVGNRFDIDIEAISDEGINILPVLKALTCLNEIKQACLHHVRRLFSLDRMPVSDYQGKLMHYHW